MDDATTPRQAGPDAADTGPLENHSFEEALTTLEETVEELRSDGLSLARALDLYEQGARLSAYCDYLLTSAELRLSRLDAASGSLSTPEVIAVPPTDDTRPDAGW